MYAFLFVVLLAAHTSTANSQDAFVDLLNGDFAGYKNVEKKNDSVLFGANTADLAIDKRSVENFVKYSADSKDTTFFAVANLHNKNFGKSTMVMLKSPFSGRTYFEVSFRKQKVLRSIVEGWTSRVEKNEIEYTLVLVYSSNGHHVEKVFPLSDKFKPGTWFTLAVRVIGDSDVEVIFDCKLFERVKLFQPMDALPRYLEGRLAHSLQRDMFTLRWTSHERFIGEMKKAMFVFGKESFQSLDPCRDQDLPGLVLEGLTAKQPLEEATNKNKEKQSFLLGSIDIFQDANCMYNWKFHSNGEEWNEGSCQICKCKNGQTFCSWIKGCKDNQWP